MSVRSVVGRGERPGGGGCMSVRTQVWPADDAASTRGGIRMSVRTAVRLGADAATIGRTAEAA